MSNRPPDDNESAAQRDPFQFGLRAILILTVVCAGIAALASSMAAPVLFRGIVALYLMLLAAYGVLRMPYILRGILRLTPAWKRLHRKRRELEVQAAEAKARLAERGSSEKEQPPEAGASEPADH